MKRLISFTSVLAIASVVLVACQKEVSTFDEQQYVTKEIQKEKIHKDWDDEWEFNLEDSLMTEWVLSVYFFYTEDTAGYYYDMNLNSYLFSLPPIYGEPIGTGRLSSIGPEYHVECIKNGGNSCGRVWVDVGGVDHEGVYYRDANGKYYVDMSWHLSYD